MRVFRGFENIPAFDGAVATLGSFDGIHRGHISILQRMQRCVTERGGCSVVLTFEPHPRVVLGRTDGLRLLTSLEERIEILEELGVDNLIVIPFDRELSRLSYEEFVRRYLIEIVGVKTLVVGYNHHIGRDSEGSFDGLTELSKALGFEICRVDEWSSPEESNVSSTHLRRLIAGGEIERANELLSRPYLIMGQIDGEGRLWVTDSLKLLPPEGVYNILIDGEPNKIEIDSNGVVSCDREAGAVRIEVLNAER